MQSSLIYHLLLFFFCRNILGYCGDIPVQNTQAVYSDACPKSCLHGQYFFSTSTSEPNRHEQKDSAQCAHVKPVWGSKQKTDKQGKMTRHSQVRIMRKKPVKYKSGKNTRTSKTGRTYMESQTKYKTKTETHGIITKQTKLKQKLRKAKLQCPLLYYCVYWCPLNKGINTCFFY